MLLVGINITIITLKNNLAIFNTFTNVDTFGNAMVEYHKELKMSKNYLYY